MRIVLVIQKLAGIRGGAERVVTELADAMRQRGHQVTIVTFEPGAASSAYPVDVEVVNLFPAIGRRLLARVPGLGGSASAVEGAVSVSGNYTGLARVKWYATHGVFSKLLRRWLIGRRVDVVVGFLPPAISAVAYAGSSMGSRRPRLVASTHNLPSVDFGESPRWDQNPVARRRNLDALEIVDHVTVLQPEFIEQLPVPAQSSAVVMPNPAATLNDTPLPIDDRESLVLGVGRLTDVKRFDILIDAFARLVPEFPEWRLEIYGDGPQRSTLQQLTEHRRVSDRVSLMGVTDQIEVQYRRARVLGHPARYEGFGLSVAEAILHRVPVVAFESCPGVRSMVENGVNGLLVADGDGEFTNGLRQLMTSPPPDDDLARAAAHLADRLDAGRVYDRWEALLGGSKPQDE